MDDTCNTHAITVGALEMRINRLKKVVHTLVGQFNGKSWHLMDHTLHELDVLTNGIGVLAKELETAIAVVEMRKADKAKPKETVLTAEDLIYEGFPGCGLDGNEGRVIPNEELFSGHKMNHEPDAIQDPEDSVLEPTEPKVHCGGKTTEYGNLLQPDGRRIVGFRSEPIYAEPEKNSNRFKHNGAMGSTRQVGLDPGNKLKRGDLIGPEVKAKAVDSFTNAIHKLGEAVTDQDLAADALDRASESMVRGVTWARWLMSQTFKHDSDLLRTYCDNVAMLLVDRDYVEDYEKRNEAAMAIMKLVFDL